MRTKSIVESKMLRKMTFALMRSAVYLVIVFSMAAGMKMSQFSYIKLSSGPL